MTELEQYRQEIDRIDGELVQLFLERMAVTGKVGEYKQRAGIPVLDAGREKQVIAAKTALTDDPARKADVAALYEEIMAISRRQQRKLVREGAEEPGYAAYAAALAARREPVAAPRVVYQGEPGCYSEEAAVGFFGPEVSIRQREPISTAGGRTTSRGHTQAAEAAGRIAALYERECQA